VSSVTEIVELLRNHGANCRDLSVTVAKLPFKMTYFEHPLTFWHQHILSGIQENLLHISEFLHIIKM